MNRGETTKFLSDLLEKRLAGKYYAREVSIDYGTVDVKRVDFLQFEPVNTINVGNIEKGNFIAYEVKSCKNDFNSGFGKNFICEKNYYVISMALYKEIVNEIPFDVGAMCPIPQGRKVTEEFENPTPLNREDEWTMQIVKRCIPKGRKKSLAELLFCMLRSGK